MINSLFPVTQEVFEALMQELTYTPFDLEQIKEKRIREIEKEEKTKKFFNSKAPLAIGVVILIILYIIDSTLGSIITIFAAILYLANIYDKKKKSIKNEVRRKN